MSNKKQTAPKELWVSESQSKERLIEDSLVVELSVSLEKVAFDDIKYISESHVEKLLTEKDNALRLASEKLLEALNETISVESDYKLYRERTTGHINILNNQIEELVKEVEGLKAKYEAPRKHWNKH